MGDDLPRSVTNGLYPAEQAGDLTFAWSHPLATITLRGMDRSSNWRCTIVARGARPDGVPQPQLIVAVDGVNAATAALTNEFAAVDVVLPERQIGGVVLSISASPPYVPGPGDPRPLGAQIDRVACVPEKAFTLPAPGALTTAAMVGALFGVLFAALGGSALSLALSLALFATAAGAALTTGAAAYITTYLDWWLPVSAWIVLPSLGLLIAAHARRGEKLAPETRLIIGITAAVLFLKIVALLHPSKDVVDAVFHARRLGWVLEGKYYFTQPMPGGVQFPYAIGLYLAAAPFAGVLRDHVALVRIVVSVFEAAAAVMVYVTVARLWQDRVTAAAALLVYHLVPLPYVVIGNANLTFAFGQSMAVLAVSVALLLHAAAARLGMLVLLFCVTSLAYLSHVAVFPLLGVTLVALGVLVWWRNGTGARDGVHIAAVAVLSAILAFAVYYAHFPEVWGTLDRVSTAQAVEGAQAVPAPAPLSAAERASRALVLGRRAFGLPVIALALAGLFTVIRGPRDRLTLGLLAWGVAMAFFVAFRVVAPVDARLQRYADEFIERVYYLTLAAAAVLAARGLAWSWRAGMVARVCGITLFAAACWVGAARWLAWLQ